MTNKQKFLDMKSFWIKGCGKMVAYDNITEIIVSSDGNYYCNVEVHDDLIHVFNYLFGVRVQKNIYFSEMNFQEFRTLKGGNHER